MSLKDSDKEAVESIVDSINKNGDTERKKFRYLNHDNTVNYEGIRNSRTEEDSAIYSCPVNGTELYFIRKDGHKRSFYPHGECWCCGVDYSFEALQTTNGMEKPSYPMIYKGFFCKSCYTLDDEKINEILAERGVDYRLGE